MFDLDTWLVGLAVTLAAALVTWLVSLARDDVSIVDITWGPMLGLTAVAYVLMTPTAAPRAALVLALVTIWALRLALYIAWRNLGEPEDRRYRAMRDKHGAAFRWKSLYIVFGLQAVIAWIISLPLLAAVTGTAPLNVLDYAGIALMIFGLGFESAADAQLARFKADPANEGRVLDRGLWRYTRHPNYFGETCVWWGLYVIAVAAGDWWSVVSPLLMTLLLLRVSGVTLLEHDISERRPAYRDYIERTNAFFPGRPR